jgi:hypothetical protein
MEINTTNLWEEEISIEPKMKLENNGIFVQNDTISETKIGLKKNECVDIGNEKKWRKVCSNCGKESFYSSKEHLKRSIKNNRSCLKCGSFKKDRYVGMKFGSLIIIKQYDSISPCGSKIVKVDYKCDCGYIGLNKRFGCIKRQKMCLKCKKNNQFKFKEKGKSSFNCLYNEYKKGAENRGYIFELTKEVFESLTKENCFYCGKIPQNIKKTLKGREIYVYNGIDRKDNNIGYTMDNCVPCCKLCNFFKSALSIDEFLIQVEKIYKHSYVENTKKWDKTGLLDELNNKQKTECALVLEKIAQILVMQAEPLEKDTKEYNIHEQYCGFVLPIARRIYSSIYPKKFPDIDWFMKDCKEFLDKNENLYNELKKSSYIALDAEAELICLYVEDCIKKIEKL